MCTVRVKEIRAAAGTRRRHGNSDFGEGDQAFKSMSVVLATLPRFYVVMLENEKGSFDGVSASRPGSPKWPFQKSQPEATKTRCAEAGGFAYKWCQDT